jgi:DNA polymerase-3 subunit gamma/tau
MSYLILARKYRPQVFEDVVAQEHVTRTLKNALRNDRIGTGYLFCGPRGTGKTTVARLLAKAVNCVKGPTDTPCGECDACREITAGSSLDVLEIDAASNTGVDDIRTLRENVRYLPTSGKKRIYIVDEVHRLSASAFDALLKTLEEPPDHVMFVFATTEPLKVPETILSRTQRYDFRRVGINDLVNHLKNIAAKENLEVEETAVQLLARKAEGSVRDALSLLDQITAFAGEKVAEQDVITALGLVDRQFLFDFVNAAAEADRRKSLLLVKALFDGGIDVGDFVSELVEHLRALVILVTDENASDLLNLPSSDLDDYREQAKQFSVGDLLRHLKILSDLYLDLKSGLDERLLLEIAAVKMAELEATVKFEDVLVQLAGQAADPPVENDTDASPDMFGKSAQKKSAESNEQQAGRPPDRAEPPQVVLYTRNVNLAQIKAGWDDFLTILRKSNRMLASQLSMAEVRSLTDNEILMVFAPTAETSRQVVSKPENVKAVTELLRDHFKANLKISFDIDPDKTNPHEEDEKAQRPVQAGELLARSPELQKILKLVDGEIIGVKKIDDQD